MKQIKTHYDCSLELAMELVGGKWKLVLLWQLLGGAKRFSELKRKLGDITQKMLTLQLRELEAAGCSPGRFIRSSRPMWNIR